MPSRSGGVKLFLLKWFLVPVALAAVGFFLIGPRIGSQLVKQSTASTGGAPAKDPLTEDPQEPEKRFRGEPKVKVEATPVRSGSRRRSSTSSRGEVRQEAPPEESPEPSFEPEPEPEPEIPAEPTGGEDIG